MDSMMSMVHAQIRRAFSSVMNHRVISEIQNVVSSLPLGETDAGIGTSAGYMCPGNRPGGPSFDKLPQSLC